MLEGYLELIPQGMDSEVRQFSCMVDRSSKYPPSVDNFGDIIVDEAAMDIGPGLVAVGRNVDAETAADYATNVNVVDDVNELLIAVDAEI